MAALPQTRSTSLTTFTLKVDGAALPGTYRIVALDIVSELNRITAASVLLHDGDAAKQDFEISNGELLVPGKTLEIAGGYERDEHLLFKGIITGQRIKVRRQGESMLHIEARDAAFRMAQARKSRYFTELTNSDLFEEIIGGYADLTADVAATSVTYPEVVQYQVSDWDLIVARAEKVGLYCVTDAGTVRIVRPNAQQPAAFSLAYGDASILDLDLEMDARTQVQSVVAAAWDQANQELITAEVDDVAAPDEGNLDGTTLAEVGQVKGLELRHSGALQQGELDAWADASMLKSRFARICGTIRCQGSEVVKPGGMIELGGMGDRFNGLAFVSGVRHTLGGGNWEMMLQIGLPPAWHHERFSINAAPGAGLYPAINGLQIGLVSQLKEDPAGEDRILVRLPLIDAAENGVWSRLATLDAGKDRGSVFRPEIDDEVIVGFINDDPQAPVVLGMLHSSSKPAPIKAADDNHEKGLVTRSGMKLVFNDETPSLTIATPKGNTIVIDDNDGSIVITDQTKNKITMNSDGIALESPGDIKLKATGDVSIEGVNVNLKASAAATLEGSSGANLKSSGTTVVKGSLVQIN
jgi:Rhs element Vgr protein